MEQAKIFWTNCFCLFFTQTKISNVCFSLFLYFREWFFKSVSYQLKELTFAHLLVVIRKKLPLMAEHAFKEKLSNLRHRTLVFNFLYLCILFFKSDSDQLKKFSFVHLLVVSKKSFFLFWRKHAFFKRKKLPFFLRKSILQTWVFLLFPYVKSMFLKHDSDQLKKLCSAYLLVVTSHREHRIFKWFFAFLTQIETSNVNYSL